MRRVLILIAILAFTDRAWADDDIEFFEKKIRPLLAEQCYSCHSANAKKLKGGLKLDSREALLKGRGHERKDSRAVGLRRGAQ